MKADNYGNESIRALKGADRVRLRPGIIFGSNDIVGCTHSVFEIISNSIDEAKAGYGDTVEITYEDDGTVNVRDYGRGVPMDFNQAEGRYNWELVFNELYAGGKMDETSDYTNSLGLNGLGCCSTQYASEFMHVESYRDGLKYTMDFREGNPVGQLKKEPYEGKTGTFIRFKPDKKVFIETKIEASSLIDMCRRQAITNPGVHLVIKYCNNNAIDLCYPDGGAGFLEDILREQKMCSVKSYNGTEYCQDTEEGGIFELKMDVAFTFSRQHAFSEFYHNSSWLSNGGKTYDGFRLGVVKTFKRAIKENSRFQKGDENINIRDVEDIMCTIFVSWCPGARTLWGNQTKREVNNPSFSGAASNFMSKALTKWMADNQKDAERVLTEIVNNKKIREKAENVKTSAIKKLSASIDSFGSRPQKFVECASKDKNERELFIVEGDSALGSCKQARDGRFQALMPVRGKITNCLKEDLVKVLNSQIILDLLQVMGCGIEVEGKRSKGMKELPKFDMDKLNFDKLIICTDADVDGMQIRCLLLTFFYMLTPSLLKAGKVYIAETPLYEITCGKETRFAYDENEKAKYLAEFTGKKVKIQRSKGLGENDPDMLSVSTMKPETRRLIRVNYSGAEEEIHALFTALLGEDIMSRREMIRDFASEYGDGIDIM